MECPGFRTLAALGLALFAYSIAIETNGNGFVAAFMAGMAFGSVVHADLGRMVEFAEQSGGLLSLLVWLIFGAAMVVPGFGTRPGPTTCSPSWPSPPCGWCRSRSLWWGPASTGSP